MIEQRNLDEHRLLLHISEAVAFGVNIWFDVVLLLLSFPSELSRVHQLLIVGRSGRVLCLSCLSS